MQEKINNSWYKNVAIDYGITGKFVNAEIIEHDLKITWEEMGEVLNMTIPYFEDYSMEQLYNIWMEG